MNRFTSLTLGLLASTAAMVAIAPPTGADPAPKSALDFTVKDIDGKDVKLSKYRGKVVMIVNTASHCGYTPQYKTLEALYEKYKDKGFIILGFPSNDFGQQEPGSNVEIKQFCTMNYKVSFDMFSKIDVKGDNKAPLYAFLTSKETDPAYPGDITWNFNKFLIDRNGNLINRFDSKFDPMTPPVTGAVEAALAAKAPAAKVAAQ